MKSLVIPWVGVKKWYPGGTTAWESYLASSREPEIVHTSDPDSPHLAMCLEGLSDMYRVTYNNIKCSYNEDLEEQNS